MRISEFSVWAMWNTLSVVQQLGPFSAYDWVQSGSTALFMNPDKTEAFFHRAESRWRREKHRNDAENLTQARGHSGPAKTVY